MALIHGRSGSDVSRMEVVELASAVGAFSLLHVCAGGEAAQRTTDRALIFRESR